MWLTDKNCPRCHEGKIIEMVSEAEVTDISHSKLLGIPKEDGLASVTYKIEMVRYTCNRNCGYRDSFER